MTERIHNFSAGPAALPLPVLKQAQEQLLQLPGAGASVLEISHRSPAFEEIIERAESNLRKLLSVPENYKVLFLQGGANLQFSMVPMNLLRDSGRRAGFIVTGAWGNKAVKESQKEGETRILWDGKDENYTGLPDWQNLDLEDDAAYIHFTSNETIQGVQFQEMPETEATWVCDMSSDFISRPVPVERFGLIYAGAQKNVGPAGATIVIIREDLLERVPDGLHTMLDYRTHAEKGSLYNTPPVFSIYVIKLVTDWILSEFGGLERIAASNEEQAAMLYSAIDRSEGFYMGHAIDDCRSRMNVTWRLRDEGLETKFIEEARKADLHGLKGHRSVGGIRASIYNAMTSEGVAALAEFMVAFREQEA
ncbi:MAG: 3-phosphoserine/phosphohydroxythreonine transaminase [Planctomycetota bacterium]|jgi:phosphoserine aminotransferase|nr:3-phosphoserine/phosphohydroxythreonine transaminase [Planctomycetota bacterium]MDP7129884.1 3-phosphoserine/phosphohydroxythreonine transaminase [Planctomycetota bacterium]MDP7249760.1 3-phosphoserine/phosphohydroxythreonine transaminase [Planctomycetota bacterium]